MNPSIYIESSSPVVFGTAVCGHKGCVQEKATGFPADQSLDFYRACESEDASLAELLRPISVADVLRRAERAKDGKHLISLDQLRRELQGRSGR